MRFVHVQKYFIQKFIFLFQVLFGLGYLFPVENVKHSPFHPSRLIPNYAQRACEIRALKFHSVYHSAVTHKL